MSNERKTNLGALTGWVLGAFLLAILLGIAGILVGPSVAYGMYGIWGAIGAFGAFTIVPWIVGIVANRLTGGSFSAQMNTQISGDDFPNE